MPKNVLTLHKNWIRNTLYYAQTKQSAPYCRNLLGL